MKVIAFDLARRTGIAIGSAGGTPRSTHIDLGYKKTDGQRFARMLEATETFLDRFKPDLVVFEAPVGGAKTSHYLVGLAACFEGKATLMGYKPISVNIGAARKHFLGKHLTSRHFPDLKPHQAKAEIKRAVIARCLSLGWDVETDDEADSCCIWDYACATYCGAQARPLGGLF